jgi:hypothetical protein
MITKEEYDDLIDYNEFVFDNQEDFNEIMVREFTTEDEEYFDNE